MAAVIPMPSRVTPEDEARARLLVDIENDAGPEALTDEEAEFLERVYPSKRTSNVDPRRDHNANLAEFMDETALARLGQDVVEWYDEDVQSRAAWNEVQVEGMRAMGATPNVDGGADFEGASRAVHPMLAEACVQFQSRAIAELWPAGGPVKGRILGRVTPEVVEQRDRVVDFMNYLYEEDMPAAYEEEDGLLYRLPLEGSMFKKVWHDPDAGTLISAQCVTPEDFVVPYTATSLEKAPRYAHRLRYHPVTVQRLIAGGYYREATLSYSANESLARTQVDDEIDDSEGRQPTAIDEDQRRTLIEMYVDLDLDDFPDRVKGAGGRWRNTGLPVPYIVTVDYDDQTVLAVRRNWLADDAHKRVKRRREWFVHKKFLPGWGFYGHGLYHVIGGLSQTATGALRALLDAAAFANLPGGYRSREAKIKDEKRPIAPGEYREVECAAEDMSKAFLPHQYKEPSAVLFNLLGYVDEKGQRLASTTDALVGDGASNTPVGTILARIEQGSKVQSAIHKRLHEANKREYRLVAALVAEYLPDKPYPYLVEGAEREILRADFDERVDIVPASDPNSVSRAERMIVAEAVLEKAVTAPPGTHDLRVAYEGYYRALKVPNIDELMPDPSQVPRAGPVYENEAIARGKPVKVYPDQDHEAHMAVHQSWFATVPPELQQVMMPAVMAHIAEHQAAAFRVQIERLLGRPLPPSPFDMDADEAAALPPEIEHEVTALTAQAVQGLEQQRAEQPPPKTPEEIEAEAKAAIATAEAQAKMERDAAAAEAEMQRKQRMAAIEAETAQAERSRRIADAEADARARRDAMRAEAELRQQAMREEAQLKRQLAAEAADAERERRRIEADDERQRRTVEAEDKRSQARADSENRVAMRDAEKTRAAAENTGLQELKKVVADLAAGVKAQQKQVDGLLKVVSEDKTDEQLAALAEQVTALVRAQGEREKAAEAERKVAEKRRAVIEGELAKLGDDGKALAGKLKGMH